MAAYDNLRAVIAANVYQNNNNEVTADMVKAAMNAMVASLGAEFQFGGVAEPGDNPGTPDYKVAYLAATPGTYRNFGGITLADGEVAILKWAGSWSKKPTGIASNAGLNNLANAALPFVESPDVNYNRVFREVYVSRHLADDISAYRVERNVSGVWKIAFTTTESGTLFIGSISADSEKPYMSGLLNDGITRVEVIVDWSAIPNGTRVDKGYNAPLSELCYNENYSPSIKAIHNAGGIEELREILTEKNENPITETDIIEHAYIGLTAKINTSETLGSEVRLYQVNAGDRLHITNPTTQSTTYVSVGFQPGAKPVAGDTLSTIIGRVADVVNTYFDVPSNGWIACYKRPAYDAPIVAAVVSGSVGIKTINGQQVVGTGNLIITAEQPPLQGKNIAILGDSIMQFMGGGVPTNTITLRNYDDPTDPTIYQISDASIVGGLLYLTSSLSGGAVTEDSVRLEIVNSAQAEIDSRGWDYIKNKLGAAEIINVAQGGARFPEMGVVTPYPCVHTTADILEGKLVGVPNQARMLKRLVDAGERPTPDAIIIWAGVNGVRNYTTDTLNEAMAIPWETLSDDAAGYEARAKFFGGIRFTIEYLYRAFPDALIMFVSPVMTSRGNLQINSDEPALRGFDNLKNVSAAIRSIAERYACPFFDALTTIGVANFAHRADTTTAGGDQVASGVPLGNLIPRYSNDGLHPNDAGKIVWGNYLCRMLTSFYFDKANN